MSEDDDESAVEAMTTEQIIAELEKHDPKSVRAALEDAMVDAVLNNANLRTLLAATLKRQGPVKH